MDVTPPREPPTKASYVRSIRRSSSKNIGSKTERATKPPPTERSKLEKVKSKIDDIFNRYFDVSGDHKISPKPIPGFRKIAFVDHAKVGIERSAEKFAALNRSRAKSSSEFKRKVNRTTTVIDEDTGNSSVIRAIQNNKLKYAENAKKMMNQMVFFKNIRPCIEAIDTEILGKLNGVLNLPLIRLFEDAAPYNTAPPLSMPKQSEPINIRLKMGKAKHVKISVNGSDSVKIPFNSDVITDLVYDPTTRKLAKCEAFYDTFRNNTKASPEKSTVDTKRADNSGVLSSLRQNAQIGMPPETPNFSGFVQPPKAFRKEEAELEQFECELKEHMAISKPSKDFSDILNKIMWSMYLHDINGVEELEKELPDLKPNEENIKAVMKGLWDIYGKIFYKVHKVMPRTSELLHSLVKHFTVLVDKMKSETKDITSKLAKQLAENENLIHERNKLLAKIKELEQSTAFTKFSEEAAVKFADINAEEDLYVVQEVAKDLNAFSDKLANQHGAFYEKVKSDIDFAITHAKTITKSDSEAIKTLLEKTKESIMQALLLAREEERGIFRKNPKTTVGTQTKINGKRDTLEKNESAAHWETVSRSETAPYTYPEVLKYLNEFMRYLLERGYEFEFGPYHSNNTQNLFRTLLIQFFDYRSATPLKEYASFIKGLKRLFDENQSLLSKTMLRMLGFSKVSGTAFTSYTYQNYLLKFCARCYQLFAFNPVRVTLYELLKVAFKLFEGYLNEKSIGSLLYLMGTIQICGESGKVVGKWQIIVALLANQMGPALNAMLESLKRIERKLKPGSSMHDLINLLNDSKVYLPFRGEGLSVDGQLTQLLAGYKETYPNGPEASLAAVLKAIKGTIVESLKVSCSILDAIVAFTAFFEEIIEAEQVRITEFFAPYKGRSIILSAVPSMISRINQKGYISKKEINYIYLDILQETLKKSKESPIDMAEHSTVYEVVSKKWLNHLIFQDLLNHITNIK